jgi:hypothetical protein
MRRPRRPRSEARAAVRARDKLIAKRLKLFARSPGGAPVRPIELESAAEVESHAGSLGCPACDGRLRVMEHTAQTLDGVRLREAHVSCLDCRRRFSIWFRLRQTWIN